MRVRGVSSHLRIRRYVYQWLRERTTHQVICTCGNSLCVNPWHAVADGTSHSRTTLADRFWRHVIVEGGCWRWTGSFVRNGYGRLSAAKDSNREAVYAHRVSWQLHRGPVPDGLYVLHTCDNRWCVKPDHLWLGTNADNMRDMVRKGRGRSVNAEKTHCKRGHEFNEENTYVLPSGGRRCRKCHSLRQCAYQKRTRTLL